MWVEMQIKKTAGIYRPRQGRMAFLWDSKALRGLVSLWKRMALDERKHGLRTQTRREDERRDGDLLLKKTILYHHHHSALAPV